MFLKNFHIFIKKQAGLQQKFTVQVTTLADCDDITQFDGMSRRQKLIIVNPHSNGNCGRCTFVGLFGRRDTVSNVSTLGAHGKEIFYLKM
jgi:hypothetical protein